jgi:hypothetical protein
MNGNEFAYVYMYIRSIKNYSRLSSRSNNGIDCYYINEEHIYTCLFLSFFFSKLLNKQVQKQSTI